MSEAQEAALKLIEKLITAQPAFDSINREARALFGDFSPYVTPIADVLYEDVRRLIRASVGPDFDMVDYFIDDCQSMDGGGTVWEADGTEWPLRTVSDFYAYLNRTRTDA